MIYVVDHVPLSQKRRPGTKLNLKGITIHSTGNPNSTAINELKWLTNPVNQNSASWHICVDQNQAVEAIPLNEVAYHASTYKGNTETIGIEICESGDRVKAVNNAVQVVVDLCRKYKMNETHLKRHYDWCKKVCPRIFYENGTWSGWIEFVNAVKNELNKTK